MIATLIDGHDTLADWLFLIAAILFALGALGRALASREGRPTLPGWFIEAGLTLVAVAWLVL